MGKPTSSPEHNVAPIFGAGGNEACVAKLEELLEQAKAGRIIGVACVSMHSDFTASQSIAGTVGGSIMIGQFRIAEHDLMQITMAARER